MVMAKTPGQLAYEADCAAEPNYSGGRRRTPWADLSPIARDSWERNPTPRASMPPPLVEILDGARLRLGGDGDHDAARNMASAMSTTTKMLDALRGVASNRRVMETMLTPQDAEAIRFAIKLAEGR